MVLRSRRKLSSAPVVNDGEFESDEDSDKETEPGTTGEAAENEDAMENVGDGEGLQGLHLADDNLNLLGFDDIPNVPPADVDPPAKKRKMNKPKLMWKTKEEENEKWVAENRDKFIDSDNINDRIKKTAEPSSDLTIPLLRFQKEWLGWALKQEASETRGGILADEMGMGNHSSNSSGAFCWEYAT